MKRLLAEPVAAPACALGESPRWAHERWWWVDVANGVVWQAGQDLLSGRRDVSCDPFQLGGRTSLVQPATRGRVVVARGTDLLVVAGSSGTTTPWASISLPNGWLLNDGTTDPAGNLWVGSVHPELRRHSGRLHCITPDGTVETFDGQTTLSNGMVWADGNTLLHVDSHEHQIISRRFQEREQHDAQHVPVPPIPLPRSTAALRDLALPDGIALDAAGGLWLALYGAARAIRIVAGHVDTIVEVPTARVTSVALGGPDGCDLLITTAQEDMDAKALAADPWAGRLFHARVPVAACETPLADPLANASTTL